MGLSISIVKRESTGTGKNIFDEEVAHLFRVVAPSNSSPMARGVLRKIVKRTVDTKSKKQTCVLDCGHMVTRSTGQISDRCYCPECSAKETIEK